MNRGKIYLAARYSRRDEMRSVAQRLAGAGFAVTSRWLYEDKPLQTKLGDDSPQFYTETARIDLDDINRADTVVFFAEDPHVGTPRGGRHVEFGYALGAGKRMVVIGGAENIFHYLPNVKHFISEQDFIESEVRQ
jgi:nucleoside 2-deoxyribosyltransferase